MNRTMRVASFLSQSLFFLTLAFAPVVGRAATTVATPTFSLTAGSYTGTQTVSISDSTSGATIYYTTNGSTPSSSSTKYTAAISVSVSETIKAIAELSGDTNSAVASAAYTITVPTPTFSPAAGTYTSSQSVTISDATSGATCYYTLAAGTTGTTPTTSSTKYTSAISVTATSVLEALCTYSGDTNSAVASAKYTITPTVATPTFSLTAGSYTGTQSLTISDSTSGATIYYTTNGTTPSSSSTKYTAAISVSTSETIEAIAELSGDTNSAVVSAAYTITVPTPTFSLAAGTYTSSQSVDISDATSGTTCYYTLTAGTAGTTPTTSSTKYTGAISVTATSVLETLCTYSGDTNSAVASAAYTLQAPTPAFSLPVGSYAGSQTVTISDTNAAATIYYTVTSGTTGTTPTASSTKYTGAITVNSTETLEAIAVVTGYTNSAIAGPTTYTISTTPGTLNIYLSQPGAQSTTVAGAVTETFDALSTGTYTSPYVSIAGIGTYTGSSSDPFAILATDEYGGAVDSGSSTPTNYFAVGNATNSSNPAYLTFTQPVSYFGFWWSAGDQYNRVALYSGSTLCGSFSTADLLRFLNGGSGTIKANNGTDYQASAYFGNPNITSSNNDSTEPFAYVSFSITGVTITQVAFYNTSTSSAFESDNHSVIFSGNNVTIPTTFVPVETLTLGSQVAAPVFTPEGGTPLNLGISSTTPGASINYTTNGTAPTSTTGTVCGTPCTIQVSAAETIEAIAYETGMTNSPVTSVTYTMPTLSVTSSNNSSTYGSSVTLTATISSGPTGTVTFYDSGTSIGTGTISGTIATFTTSTLAIGTHTITAGWVGNASYGSVLSGAITQTVNLEAQTINFPVIPTQTVGTPLTLSATASSGLAVTFTSATQSICTVTGTTATFVASGTCTIDANQAGNSTYAAATMVPQSFQVNGESQTIAFPAPASPVTYGVSPIALSATASSGLPVTFRVASGPGSILGSTLTITGAGTVVVAANQAGNTNYAAAAQVTQSIVVTQAVLTVTAGNASRAYGAANPSFTDTITGYVNGDTSSAVSGSPSLTTTATSTSAVGTYPITASVGTLAAANYSFTFVAGTLTVTQASTTITCSPVAITYGTSLSLTQLNCTSGGVTGNFVLTPTVGTVLPAGTQSISVAFTPTDTADYKTATASVSLTVNQATPTITWATPATVPAGTALSATQLDATANVPGTFVYTPASGAIPPAGTQTLSVTFTPTDTTDYSTATATVALTVNNLPVSVSVTPVSSTLSASGTQQFTATVSNTSNTTVTWSISPVGAGSISATGLYTAPATIPIQQTVTVTATSQADTTQSTSATVTLVPAQCTSNGYGYQRAITIDHTKVPNTDQANFPFLFNTTDPLLATTANNGHVTSPNGYDIIFTSDPAGQNVLDYEMEEYNPTTGQVIAWVRIPTLSHTSDTFIYLFYGNPNVATSQQNPTGVWDSNYVGVYHFPNGATLSVNDSTGNENNGTNSGATATAGEIGGAAAYNGGNQYTALPRSIADDFTISAWFKTKYSGSNNTSQWYAGGQIVSGEMPGAVNDFGTAIGGGAVQFGVGNPDTTIYSPSSYNDGNWHYMAAARVKSTGEMTLYVDGVEVATGNGGTNSQTAPTSINVANDPAGAGYFPGSVDEVQLSAVARSGDWIAAEYSNQSSPSGFYAVGSETDIVSPSAVTLYASQSQQFTGSGWGACGSNAIWTINPEVGAISASGLYTAPASITTQQTVTVTATSGLPGSDEGTATVNLMPPVTVSVTPPSAMLYGGQTQRFIADVANSSNQAVNWTISPAGAGAISTTGLYSAPATFLTQQTVVVTATSQEDLTQSASATLILTPTVFVSLTPPGGTLSSGQTQLFTATVGDTNDQEVTWTINPVEAGAISSTGLYTAPAIINSLQTVTVTAMSEADQTKLAIATVTLTPISPTSGPAGTVVTINGVGFGTAEGSNSVTVGGLPAVTLFWSDTQIQAQIPTGTGLGAQNVVVTIGNQVNTAATFTVTAGLIGITPPPNGVTASTTIDTPNQTAPLIFSGTAGQLVSVLLTNFSFSQNASVNVSILNPDGTTLVSTGMYAAWWATNLFQNPVTLPTTGIYSLVVAPQNGFTGSTTETLYLFNNQVGTIAPGVPTASTISIPGQEQLLTFSGTAGQLASVLLTNFSFSQNASVNVSILNPDGTTLVSTGMYAAWWATKLFQNPVTLPTTGIYSLVVAPQYGFTGSTTVTLQLFQNQIGAITSGSPVSVTTAFPGQEGQLTFNGTAGQLASVLLTNFNYPSGAGVTVSILNPDGTTLVSTGMYTAWWATNLFQNPVTLPVTGTYTLVVAPQNGVTGSATVNLWLFYNQVGTITSGIPAAFSTNIPGQEELLTFFGDAGQAESVQLSNFNFPSGAGVTVSILNPDGTTLVSTGMYTASWATNLFQNPVTLPVTGTYTLVVAPQNGVIGSTTVLLTLVNPEAVTINVSLVPVESQQGSPVTINATLATRTKAVPTGTVSCSGSGVNSAPVSVNSMGGTTVLMNGLPLGKNAIVCSFTSNNISAFFSAVSAPLTETVTALPSNGSVSVTPASASLYGGQVQQFSASVLNTSNQTVTWAISPSGAGTISATGFYAAPASVASLQTVTVTATSQANTSQSASAMITLSPAQCASSGYNYQRSIVIDHTKIPNSDQADFPFLFNTTDPSLATTANGGHVSNPNGYDIIFSTDPAGLTKLDHELEQFNPATGQVIAWVRIPTLSHTSDTVLYVFYGNSSITTSQQNPTGVWDSNYGGVWHLDGNGAAQSFADSTANANNATVVGSVTEIPGEIGNDVALSGSPNYIDAGHNSSVLPTHTGTFSVWVNYNAFAEWTTPMGNGSDATDRNGVLFWNWPTGELAFEVDGPGGMNRATAGILATGQWYYLTGTWDGSTVSLYENGTLVGSTVQTLDASPAYDLTLGVDGALSPSGDYLNGSLDEARVSGIARSADWIAAEYSNQSSPSTFYALRPENAEEIVPATVSLYASQSQHFTVLGSVAGSCSSPSAIWSMPSGVQGTLTAGGVYTAPNSITSQQTVPITATTLGDSTNSFSAAITLVPPITVSVSPGGVVLNPGQTQQFTASVNNISNTAVAWTIDPGGAGSINSAGLYTAPPGVMTQQTINIVATSQADPTQSALATVTLSSVPISPISPLPTQCASSGYGYQRVVVIDHTKVSNTDQTNFPFLFNTTDPSLATIANGGQVTNSNGYDIIFSTDPNGLTKLDHELEEYNPATGQVIAWVRIPTLSHTTDTVLYVFYGNPSVIGSQQNPTGVWDSNYTGVYHLANAGALTAPDSTGKGNNATSASVLATSGQIDGAGSFDGGSSYIQIPETDFPNYPSGVYDNVGLPSTASAFSSSFGVWFKTASAGGILGQSTSLTCTWNFFGCISTGPIQPGNSPYGSWDPLMYVDDNGSVNGFGLVSPAAYNDNNWHFAVTTYAPSATNGTTTLYVDGKSVASGQVTADGYDSNYAYFVGVAYTFESSEGNWNWQYFNGNIDEVTVSNISRSADWIQTEYNNQGSPSTFYTFNSANTVQVVPSAITLYAGQSQQFATTVACNTSVLWTMSSGAQGTLTSSGLYTAPSSIATQQTVTITATNLTNGSTIGSAAVLLQPPPSPVTLVASAQSPYTTGTSQPFTATLLDQNGAPESGVAVTFTVAGANSNIGSGVTGGNGVASYAYTGANTGNDTIRATAVVNGQAVTSNSVSASWIVPAPAIPAAGVTLIAPPALGAIGLVGAFTDNSGAVIEPIAIGASSREYVVPVGATQLQLGVDSAYFVTNGGPGFAVAVNGVSVTIPSTAMPWTWAIGGLNNNYQYGIYNPSIQNAILDGTNPVVAATGLTGGQTVTIAYQSGTASANYPLRPLVNADGDQSAITGVQVWQGAYFPTLYTTTSSYPVGQPITFNALVADATGAPLPNVPVTLNVTGANPQQLPAMTDSTGTATFMYIGSNPGTDSLLAQALPSSGTSLVSSQSSVTWINYATPPAPGTLNLQLLAHVEDAQGYEVLATDASGNPVFDANIGFYVWGVDNFQRSGRTDVTGHVMFTYNHLNPGTYNIVAVEPTNRNIVFSNAILNQQWTGPSASSPTGNTITINISGNTSLTMPGILQLNGSVTDGNGLTPSVTWSQVSGPGTVTFTSPNQAVTTAAFSDVGSYVLQLSASDATGNSGSVQWPVTVYPPVQDPQGWVGSPTYGSTVTGVVPITLAPGVLLQSGILTYYSATNTNNVIVLNANTTGSGQIGTLDTTVLANGGYWIQLQATDTSGETQYSLVLVTVAGNYKPGRVTATVTDLVVPATGLAINIQRTYDSLNAATSSDFGYGWSLGINTNLTVDPAGNVTFTLGGQRRTFYLTPQPNGFLAFYDVVFTPELGLHGTLKDTGSGCSDLMDFVLPDGSLWDCIGGGQYNPPGYVYTDPNGTSYTISATGNLQSMQDRSGNGLTITANGITSSTGLSVPFVRDASNRITQITDPQGNIYQYGYDASGNLATVTYPNTTTPSTYTYDANHLYLSGTDARSNPLPVTTYFGATDTDPNGNSLSGRLQSVSDALGETTSYAYNLATNTTTVTYPPDANGNVGMATMIYDSYGKLLSSTDPLGNTTTNVYDANHNLISTTDPLGHTTTSTYDNKGNKTSSTYPATATSKNTTSYTVYNQYSEPTQTTDELGNVRAFNYDANYNPQSVTDSSGTLASFIFNANTTLQAGAIGFDISTQPGMASQFTYDANGNMVSRTDALGRTTTYTYNSLGQKTAMVAPTPTTLTGGSASTTLYQYDALGNLIQTAAPLGRTTGSTYDANGNKISSTDARGNVTTYQYDPLNRLIETDYPSNSTTPATKSTKTYDFRNNVIRATDQNGNVTLNAYDLAGRLISVTRGYGTSSASTTTYGYDNAGRKVSETDALGHTTSYTYDADSRLIAVSGVAGNFQYTYDDAGNQVARTDGNNNTTQFQYDARKRLIKTAYPDGTSVTNSYDGPGNLASVTDQASNVVQYTYDAANQLKTVVQLSHPNPSNDTNFYGYDNLGNLSGLTDENLHTTQNWFDLFNEPVQKTLPDGSLTETRTYDAAGNLKTLTHFNGVTTTYTYDALNRLLTRATPGEATVSFTYTATGKRATMSVGSWNTTYSYDSLDRLAAKAAPAGTLTYSYDGAGNLASMSSNHANGVSVSYAYDELNRLSSVTDERLQGNQTTTYTYDTAGNVATVTAPNGLQTKLNYDPLNRLTSLSTPVSSYSYTLGATGNRTNAVEGNGRSLSWNYDGIYRLTNETISSDPEQNDGSASYGLDPVGNRLSLNSTLTGVESGSFGYNADDEVSSESYDSNGNTLATGGKTFTYDPENHLTSMNGGAVRLIYDGDGNRVAKTVGGVTTQYLVDDLNPTGLPQVVEEVVNGAVVKQYTYGLQRISENQVVSNAWTPSFYVYDGAGSVRQLTNVSGVVTDEYEYDAYGNSFTKQGTTPNNYLYRGEQFDSDLGLYYLRARYYNAGTGRFMSRDPEDGKAKIPATLHKYLYAAGNPANRVDPTGRDFVDYVFSLGEIALDSITPIAEMVGNFIELQAIPATVDAAEVVATFAEDAAEVIQSNGLMKFFVCDELAFFGAKAIDEIGESDAPPDLKEMDSDKISEVLGKACGIFFFHEP